MAMRLYTSKGTPFGRTVEVVAHELGLHEELEIVEKLVKPTEADAEFRAVSGLRKIPVLVTEEGTTLVDSAVICEYLTTRVGDRRIFARDAADRFAMLSRYALARGVAECAVLARYEWWVRPEPLRWDAWIDDLMDKIGATLAGFEADPPAHAGSLTIADIALGVSLGYLDFRYPDYGWRKRFPRLAEWYGPIDARPSFAATRPA